ncbi:hypothetical protein CC1G_06711 [Coprinopsis cinerea okayama7|uniref:Uncharacterized protein n=1 Tax=Coprinopsis cinerea (strain Okayama-7 / 130 / ATCC MYA-4618 / FGSC 9003) TaxID=240176 RepID=A8N1N1_COPC7|nr:hypothetical protein CC1G_06711 [Coprinopsis cinerea okayama7\|eukprot:XP_001828725.2 hypothetical protein CC1G_06711 [Coprinopsis cinerea okayama7\
MDFIQSLDSSKLTLYGTALSFLLSTTPALSYNFPLFLFGTYIQEQNDAVQSLQTFTGLLAASILFDVISFFTIQHTFWTSILTVFLLLLKVPTFLAFTAALRQRGSELSLGMGGANIQGATLWAMPGGFTSNSRDGYQPVDDDAFVRPAHQSIPTNPPMPQPAPANPAPAPPGAYQNV